MGEINAEMSEIRADIGDNNHQRGKISGLVCLQSGCSL